ncbi:hypothetical protein MMC25_003212 [Agyrium rufum]|nr:hypothetical protein [Agyrium rufum]
MSLFRHFLRALWSGNMLQTPLFHSPPQQAIIDISNVSRSVPGGSVFRFCEQSGDADIFAIDLINLDWDPPIKVDDNFDLYIYGTFLEDLSENATFTLWTNVSAEWGHDIKAYNDTRPFCYWHNDIEQPDPDKTQQCPPEKGFALLSTHGWFSRWFVGEGNFTFRLNPWTEDGRQIYCVEADVELLPRH